MQDDSRTSMTRVVPEGATAVITGNLIDETGAAVSSTGIFAFTLTLRLATNGGTIINGRDDTSILNAGPGVVTTSGGFTITLAPADNDIVSSPEPADEKHAALLEWTYSSSGAGAKYGKHEIDYQVRSIARVT